MAKLIKITTIDAPDEYIKPYIAYINPDKIIDVQQAGGGWLIDLGGEDHRYSVSDKEWARIEPLLVDEVQAVLPAEVLEAWREFEDASWDFETSDSSTVPAAFDDTRSMFLTRFGDFVDQMRRKNTPVSPDTHAF